MSYYHSETVTQSNGKGLKPMGLTQTTSRTSVYSTDSYNALGGAPTYPDNGFLQLERRDTRLKKGIRILRFASRILSALLAAATVTPLLITLVKYLQTRNTTITVDGEQRTAWSSDTQTWFLYTYLAVSGISFILDTAILISYCKGGVKSANKTAKYAGYYSLALTLTHLVIWIVSVAIYRYGAAPLPNGKSKDLWGWTCSSGASEIQGQVNNVNYSQYCAIQTTSFYTGIANVVSGILTASIYVLVLLRSRSKKSVQTANLQTQDSREPLRHY